MNSLWKKFNWAQYSLSSLKRGGPLFLDKIKMLISGGLNIIIGDVDIYIDRAKNWKKGFIYAKPHVGT